MLRAIFIPEFKRSLLQKLLVVAPVLAGLYLLEQLLSAGIRDAIRSIFNGTPDVVIDALLWILIILSGFIVGAGAFARTNERHIPFVHSLPMPRLEIWIAIVGAHFLTTLLMVPVILILRPSLWRQLTAGVIANGVIEGIGVYFVLFAAGCCFVMLFRSIVLAMTAGGIIAAASLVLTGLFASTVDFRWRTYFGLGSYHRVYGIPLSGAGPEPAFWFIGCLVLAILYLGLSLRFFTRGEFILPRTRIRNWGALCAVLAAYPLLLSLWIESGLLPAGEGVNTNVSVSADGKYLAVFKNVPGHMLLSEITFVSTQSGTVGTYRVYGLSAWSWSKSGSILSLSTFQSPLWRLAYLLPPTDSIVRITPEGQILHRIRFRFTQIEDIHADRKGRLLVSAVSHGQAKLLAVDDRGESAELVSTPMKDEVALNYEGSTNLFIVQSSRNGLERGWSIEEQAREIPYSARDTSHAGGRFLFDDGWYSESAAAKELARRFPLDPELQARGGKDAVASYFVPWGLVKMPNDWAFAAITNKVTGSREILAFSKQRGTWRIVKKLFALGARSRTPTFWPALQTNGAISWDEGVTVLEEGEGKNASHFLYDVKLDQRVELPGTGRPDSSYSYCGTPRSRPWNLDGIFIPCTRVAFIYKRGEEIRTIPHGETGAIYVGADGTSIETYDYPPTRVDRVTPDGKVTPLWRMR